MDTQTTQPANVTLAAEIVSAYVSKNPIPTSQLPELISSIHRALHKLGQPQAAEPEKREPAVPIKKSVTPDAIISLFDGKRFKSLKRYLRVRHNMTPDQYRAYWGLRPDYPMVAPNYTKTRSELAKGMGLGRKPGRGRRNARKKAA